MQEEYRADGCERNAGEGSPEQRGGANTGGGEPSPVSSPVGGPPDHAAADPTDGHADTAGAASEQAGEAGDLDWQSDPPPRNGLERLPLPPNLAAKRSNHRALVRPQLPQG